MLKKVSLSLLTAVLLTLSNVESFVHATDPVTSIYSEFVTNNRLLIPLRTVSEKLGADVNWNKEQNSVTITKSDTHILLPFNSNKVWVNDSEVILDAPAKSVLNSTYVPLRFVSQTLGASVEWNQQSKQALITLDGTQLQVIMLEPKIEVPNSKRISDNQRQVLINKLNEATKLSSIKQVRAYFRPYFTDRLINEVIRNNGLEYDYVFKKAYPLSIAYTTQNSGSLTQSSTPDSEFGAEKTQSELLLFFYFIRFKA